MGKYFSKTARPFMLFAGLFFMAFLFMVQKSFAEAAITVGDDVKIKFGVLFQSQIDESQIATGGQAGYYNQNMFLRRARVLIGGQLAPRLTFFTETEAGFVGKQGANSYASANATNKNIETTGLNVLDAVLTWTPVDMLNIDTGLILVPICRNCLQGAATLLPLNYFTSAFVESVATGSDISRDTGVQLRSYLLNDKLEIRLGAFQGYRNPQLNPPASAPATGSPDPFRVTGRIQYNFLEAEKGFYYTGTYLGKKKVLAIGAGYDAQGDYRSQAFDVFADYPVTETMSVSFQVDKIRWMPGTFTIATGPVGAGGDQDDWAVEAGLYHAPTKLMPFFQYEAEEDAAGIAPATRLFQGGIAYYFSGYNGNLKLSAGFKDTGVAINSYANQFTLQLQGFYF